MNDYELVVVGGGAGGMAAARAGVRRKAKTLLIQDGPIGGDCTFTGCVPSKAMIAAAARKAPFSEAMASVHRAIEHIAANENDDVFNREGVEVLHGRAQFRSPSEVEVDGRRIHARRCIIATGAGPAVPPIDGLRELEHLTNETVFQLQELPPTLAVLGGGAIGCELAQAFARLGARVTVLEALERILPLEEPEASEVVTESLAADGVSLRTGQKVVKVEPLGDTGRARLHVEGGQPVEADRVLVAVGRRPASQGLGLEAAGIEVDQRGFIKTDDALATTAKGVFAVGDVCGKLQFTHAADEMGRIAAGNALSRRGLPQRRFRSSWIPWVTFTDPEVGRVGMTESQAAEHGGRVAYVPMSEVDRAITTGQTRGFLKLVAGPRRGLRNLAGGRVLGATVVAPRGGELVHEAALAMRTNMFVGRLAQTVHAYPSWSTAVQQAAAQFFIDVDGRRARPAHR